MKQIVIGVMSGVATAAMLFISGPAYASQDPIESWVKSTNKQIERRMVYPNNGQNGVVIATFQIGQDGRPTAITVRSSDPALMRAARSTLNRVRNLAPLPDGYGNTRIRLQMLVGDPSNVAEYQAQRHQLLATARQNNTQLAMRLQPVQVAATQPR